MEKCRVKPNLLLKYLPNLYTDGSKLTQPQVAIVAIDPTTGEIKAMIGGRGEDKFNRAVLATRQPGSSFKAFVYLTAMDNGLTAATVVR
jgi:penicillin-binding protein 1A